LSSAFATAISVVDLGVQNPRATTAVFVPRVGGSVSLEVGLRKEQRIAGFGASGAWWSGLLYRFKPDVQKKLGELLFTAHGLDLSQFRFNIGGGGVGVKVPFKRLATMYVGPGRFDWNRDAAGVYYLRMAQRYGVRDLIGFVNSAPPAFTTNHQSCAGSLMESEIVPYADYLAQLVAGLRSHLGIKLSYVSPMNEPANAFPSCKQEGMAVPVALRGPLVVALGRALARYAPWCRIIADESSQIGPLLLHQLPKWIHYPGALHYLSVVAHHAYDFPPASVLREMRSYIATLHRPSWMTEICCYQGAHFGYQYDPTISSGLWLASTIYKDIAIGGDSAFQWWLAASPDLGCNTDIQPNCWRHFNYLGRNDGLLYFDINGARNGNQALYLTKRFWVMANFSRFIRPGAVNYATLSDSRSVRALAVRRGHIWTVVVINQRPSGDGPLTLQLDFPPGYDVVRSLGAWRTSATLNLSEVSLPQLSGATVVTSLPSASVTTYQFQVR
jgi:O-glycosyl hydrolase